MFRGSLLERRKCDSPRGDLMHHQKPGLAGCATAETRGDCPNEAHLSHCGTILIPPIRHLWRLLCGLKSCERVRCEEVSNDLDFQFGNLAIADREGTHWLFCIGQSRNDEIRDVRVIGLLDIAR